MEIKDENFFENSLKKHEQKQKIYSGFIFYTFFKNF